MISFFNKTIVTGKNYHQKESLRYNKHKQDGVATSSCWIIDVDKCQLEV